MIRLRAFLFSVLFIGVASFYPLSGWTGSGFSLPRDLSKKASIPDELMQRIHSLSFDSIYQNCSTYPKGEKKLKLRIESAAQKGLKCIAGLGLSSRSDAENLLSILEDASRPISIHCKNFKNDFLARAFKSNHSFFPGMEISLSSENLDKGHLRESIFFHEMLHWLGYEHTEGFDIPYLAQNCCFGRDEASKRACDIIQNRESIGWDTPTYQQQFSNVMTLRHFPGRMTLRATWHAFRNHKSGEKNLNSEALFAYAMGMNDFGQWFSAKKWRKEGNPALGVILGTAAIKALSKPNLQTQSLLQKFADRFYPYSEQFSKQRQFFVAFGEVLYHLAAESEVFEKSFQDLNIQYQNVCLILSPNEMEQIRTILRATNNKPKKTQITLNKKHYKFDWKLNCLRNPNRSIE